MSSVRFTEVVKQCGRPESYIILTDPAKDKELQAALKAQKVMTVFQASPGGKADHGEVGLEAGPGRQFLVFPKSLSAYAGRPVIGIKYDLLESAETTEKEPPPKPPKPPKAPKPAKKSRVAEPRPKPEKPKPSPPVILQRAEPVAPEPAKASKKKREADAAASSKKVIDFEPAEKEENEEVARLKKQVRRAMAALEEGKEVAAFNLLKQIVD